MDDEFIKKLREKYEKGEISKETYEDILRRYIEDAEEQRDQEVLEENFEGMPDVEEIVDKSVSQAMEEMEKSLEKTFPEEKKRGYKCAGSCVLPPGKYEYISSAGSLTITGDIEADRISVAGSMSCEGSIKADFFKAAGSAKIRGTLKADTISIAGALKAGDIVGDDIRIAGGIKCGNVKGDRVRIEGSFSLGSVEGDSIRIKVEKKCIAKKIHGDKIRIESKHGLFRKFSGMLEVKEIVGDEIYLEAVKADYVKGDSVVVGDNCIIGILESENMRISKKSKVKEVRK